MEKLLDRLETKIDKLDTRLDSIDVTLAAQHVSLKEHMRRTELLEDAVVPLKKHVGRIQGAFAFIGSVATISVIVDACINLIHFLRK